MIFAIYDYFVIKKGTPLHFIRISFWIFLSILPSCQKLSLCNPGDTRSNCGLLHLVYQSQFVHLRPSALSAPTGFSVQAGNTKNTITWNQIAGVTYKLYWSNNPGNSRNSGNVIPLNQSPFRHTGLTNSLTYYYSLSASLNGSEIFTATELSGTPQFLNLKTYVTSSNYSITSINGVAGADAKCMSDSGKPNDNSIYKALLVDETGCSSQPCRRASITGNLGDGQIDWVFLPNTTYTRSDGTTVIMTTNANALFVFGTLTNSWTATPTTGVSGMSGTWTTFSNSNCTNYTSTGGSVTTTQYQLNSSASLSGAGLGCNLSYYLLCIEQ